MIDGDWCSTRQADTIRGPEIVTPSGKQTRSDSRPSFSYVIPAGEPGAGETVSIILRNDRLPHATGKADTPWQEWRRCTANS
jgi:hypothetical protein